MCADTRILENPTRLRVVEDDIFTSCCFMSSIAFHCFDIISTPAYILPGRLRCARHSAQALRRPLLTVFQGLAPAPLLFRSGLDPAFGSDTIHFHLKYAYQDLCLRTQGAAPFVVTMFHFSWPCNGDVAATPEDFLLCSRFATCVVNLITRSTISLCNPRQKTRPV